MAKNDVVWSLKMLSEQSNVRWRFYAGSEEEEEWEAREEEFVQ